MNIASSLSGKSRSLDRKVASDELVSEADITDVPKMARLLTRILRSIADLRRTFVPRRTDFEDRAVGSGTYERFPHGFGGRVRWWVVDSIGTAPILLQSSVPAYRSDENTLILYSAAAPTVTIRVEEAG